MLSNLICGSSRSEAVRRNTGFVATYLLTLVIYSVATGARMPYAAIKDDLRHYAPFEGEAGYAKLGALDTIFMFCYAVSMPILGRLIDRGGRCVSPLGVRLDDPSGPRRRSILSALRFTLTTGLLLLGIAISLALHGLARALVVREPCHAIIAM